MSPRQRQNHQPDRPGNGRKFLRQCHRHPGVGPSNRARSAPIVTAWMNSARAAKRPIRRKRDQPGWPGNPADPAGRAVPVGRALRPVPGPARAAGSAATTGASLAALATVAALATIPALATVAALTTGSVFSFGRGDGRRGGFGGFGLGGGATAVPASGREHGQGQHCDGNDACDQDATRSLVLLSASADSSASAYPS